MIKFTEEPPKKFLVTNTPRDPAKALAMKSLIQELRSQRVIVTVPTRKFFQGLYLHVFFVQKHSGKFRVILNLKMLNR